MSLALLVPGVGMGGSAAAAPAPPAPPAPPPAPPALPAVWDVDGDTLEAVRALWLAADVDEFEDD